MEVLRNISEGSFLQQEHDFRKTGNTNCEWRSHSAKGEVLNVTKGLGSSRSGQSVWQVVCCIMLPVCQHVCCSVHTSSSARNVLYEAIEECGLAPGATLKPALTMAGTHQQPAVLLIYTRTTAAHEKAGSCWGKKSCCQQLTLEFIFCTHQHFS